MKSSPKTRNKSVSDETTATTTTPAFYGLLTQDAGMQRVFRLLEKAAQSEASVLLRGETGSGKELLAQALHQLSHRQSGPFHAISCAALPASLLESELFGHVRGAFTGAVRDNPGHFRSASRGTLFLDEVAEMPLEVQAKLLRVLETHTIIPVGGHEPISVDVRIVAATHKGLRAEVEAGRFRADLMYRLRVVPIFIPALRERPGDILLLAHHFIHELNQRSSRHIHRISTAAAALLKKHDWPGNVRELRNVIEYAFVVGEGETLEVGDFPPELLEPEPLPPRVTSPPPSGPLVPTKADQIERIRQALRESGGHYGAAAALLQLSRVTLWRKMKQLGLLKAETARRR